MTNLVNFVLRCTGCSLTVDVHDIEDPDNAVSKLTDLQEEYSNQKPTDYPLISRLKTYSAFRSTLTSFFETLIQTCHASGLLYSDLAIIENIEVWVSTMSSSGMRPFRHTATVISLAIGTQLCRVATELADTTAQTTRQKEGEWKHKKVNKERIRQLETKLADLDRKRVQVRESLTSIFEAVYVHRYRDVDPKIRVECVASLGDWIATLPDVFFEGTYLRYLGWVLSDTFAPTRAEDIKQLTRLFKNKDNIARLRTFTERFRSRLVEMAMQDSEVGIRASTVEMLGFIREAGLLEPDDIDNIGRLVFDTESKVRKAVVTFFAENINDIYDNSLEELGGLEGLPAALQEEKEGELEAPRLAWLKLKSVVEALEAYDAGEDDDVAIQDLRAGLLAAGSDSRYTSAAQTICEGVAEAKDWEVIAGYLLYDFSATKDTFEEHCSLSEREQIFLLEILNVSVKQRLVEAIEGEADRKGKRTKAQKDQSRVIQESTALHLAKIIPNLLKKFGPNPATTTGVLRLEHVLNLEIFQELREDSTAYASLLEDINKQFLAHTDSAVLAEASSALLHARNFEDLEEITHGKVQELWDDTTSVLRVCMSRADWVESILDISDAVRRIAHLASIVDCTEVFRATPKSDTKQKKKAASTKTASTLNYLLQILSEPALDSEAGQESDDTLTSTMKALLLYHMWLAQSLQTARTIPDFDDNFYDFSPFTSTLTPIAQGRHPSSPVRSAALGTLLDLHTLFATFRHKDAPLPSLVQPIPSEATPLILSTFTNLEKSFAKKSHKKLDTTIEDDLSSPEDLDDDDEDDAAETDDLHKAQETLLAEKRLCEFTGKVVLALTARVLEQPPASAENHTNVRDRILRNRFKLGQNFKEVLAYLDEPKEKAPPKRRKAATRPAPEKSKVNVLDESDEDDEVGVVAPEEGGEDDIRARELVDDRIEDPDDDVGEQITAGRAREEIEDEDEIMGD